MKTRCCRTPASVALQLAAVTAALTASPAIARAECWGCATLPSRFTQYLGWGYGAGHHAPIVKTPGLKPQSTPRWTFHAASEGPLYPAPYFPQRCLGEECFHPGPFAMPVQPFTADATSPELAPSPESVCPIAP